MSLKFRLCGALFCLLTANAVTAGDEMSIEGTRFTPSHAIVGDWLGDPEVGGITDYGVVSVAQNAAFLEASEMAKLVQTTLSFVTTGDIHAVHVHGVGSGVTIDTITGYSVISGNEAAQSFQMKTFVRERDGFVLEESTSGPSVGALDCDSIAKLAIMHSPANAEIVSITLGKTHYPHDSQSELSLADYLSEATKALAKERADKLHN